MFYDYQGRLAWGWLGTSHVGILIVCIDQAESVVWVDRIVF